MVTLNTYQISDTNKAYQNSTIYGVTDYNSALMSTTAGSLGLGIIR